MVNTQNILYVQILLYLMLTWHLSLLDSERKLQTLNCTMVTFWDVSLPFDHKGAQSFLEATVIWPWSAHPLSYTFTGFTLPSLRNIQLSFLLSLYTLKIFLLNHPSTFSSISHKHIICTYWKVSRYSSRYLRKQTVPSTSPPLPLLVYVVCCHLWAHNPCFYVSLFFKLWKQ